MATLSDVYLDTRRNSDTNGDRLADSRQIAKPRLCHISLLEANLDLKKASSGSKQCTRV